MNDFEAYLEQQHNEFHESQWLSDWRDFLTELEGLMGADFDPDGAQEEDGYSLDFIDELRDEGWSAAQIATRIKEKRPEDRLYFRQPIWKLHTHYEEEVG